MNGFRLVGWLVSLDGTGRTYDAYSANDDEETLTTPAGRQGVAVQC